MKRYMILAALAALAVVTIGHLLNSDAFAKTTCDAQNSTWNQTSTTVSCTQGKPKAPLREVHHDTRLLRLARQTGSTELAIGSTRERAGATSLGSTRTKGAELPATPEDFATRCHAPGVVRCVTFDSPQEAGINGKWGDNQGTSPNKYGDAPTIDTKISADGAGSLRIHIPALVGAKEGGDYWTNFSPNLETQFGGGDEFWIQWRQRFSSNWFHAGNPGPGFKLVDVSTGDKPGCSSRGDRRSVDANPPGPCGNSCTALETVVVTKWYHGFPTMYQACRSSASHGPYDPFQTGWAAGGGPRFENGRGAPYCLWSQIKARKQFPPTGNCFPYKTGQWMTFELHFKLGPREAPVPGATQLVFKDSHIDLWGGYEGKAMERIFDWGPYDINAGTAAQDQKFGKIWLMTFNTHRNPRLKYPVRDTWYDDLIISRTPIAPPR